MPGFHAAEAGGHPIRAISFIGKQFANEEPRFCKILAVIENTGAGKLKININYAENRRRHSTIE